MGFENELEQSYGRPYRQTNDRPKRTCELTSSIVPRGTPFHFWVELEFPPISDLHAGFPTGLPDVQRRTQIRSRAMRRGGSRRISRSYRIYLRHCQAEELHKEFGSTGSRLIVNNMARGIYLIGSKREGRVRAVQIVDRAGNSTTLRLRDYMSRKIQPGYTALPWQQDFMRQENDSKATKQTADK
jgi:hypothetical protein